MQNTNTAVMTPVVFNVALRRLVLSSAAVRTVTPGGR